MSLFHQKKQSFTTMDFVSLVALVGIVGSVSGAILAEAFHPETSERTEAMAEAFSHQLAGQQVQARAIASLEGHRGPASVQPVSAEPLTSGFIGKDSWGHPFHYLVHKYAAVNSPRPTFRIFVWSDGPDGKSDSDPTSFANLAVGSETIHRAGTHLKFKLGGDDIGYSEEALDEPSAQTR